MIFCVKLFLLFVCYIIVVAEKTLHNTCGYLQMNFQFGVG